jgi:YidC/Oxa1 family membrane protein insertase
MGAIANLFGYLLNFLYNTFNNYGIAIIVFSVILRIILIPVTIFQQKSMKKSAELQEKMKEIQKKYKNNPEKLNQETMNLYKTEKVNPLSGCLSSILQIIIILSVFWLVSKPLTYMKKVPQDTINNYVTEIKEAGSSTSAYQEIDVIKQKGQQDENVNINLDFFGIDLSMVPNANMKDLKVYIIPVLYVLTSFLSMKLTNKQAKTKKKKTLAIAEKSQDSKENIEKEEKDPAEEAAESMELMSNSMNYMFPIMAISISFVTPLGLALYWLVSNVLIMIERVIIDKVFDKKDEKKGEKENA